MITGSLSDRLFLAQSEIIKEKANAGSCIFVGRCSDVVLENFDNAYHFYIYAAKDRIARIMEVERHAEDMAALKIIKKMDKRCRSYYQFYTERKWGSCSARIL